MAREPYRSPQRQLQHYRLKRNQILTVLGKASFMNGSAFAILFVTSTGESEVFGSKAFQGRLGNWIGSNVKDEARICLDTEWRERDEQAKQGRTLANPADIFSSKGEVFHVEPDGEDGLEPLEDSGEELIDGIYSDSIRRQQQQQTQQQQAQQQQLLTHSTLQPQQSQIPSGTQPSRPSEILSTPVLQHTPFPSTSTYLHPEEPSSGESSSRITRSISSSNLAEAVASSSTNPNSNPVALRSVTFTPSSLNSWYTDKLSGLQSKASKVVCKLWIKAAQPDKSIAFPYGTGTLVGATLAPPWWPPNLRHKDPDHLSKSERVTLGNALLRTSGIPLSTFERATSKQSIQADTAALLADLYNVAAEERKALFANDNQPFEFLQVVLPIPASSFNTYTQTTAPQIPPVYVQPTVSEQPVRAAPYTLSRSHSTADVLSQSVGPRPLARSQSHSGYPTTGRDTTRRSRRPPRSSLGGSTRETAAERSEGGSPFRQSTTPRGLSTSPQPNYNNPLSFSDAGDALMAPIALQSSQNLRDPSLSASRRGSHDGTPYQSRASPSSYRMQASPSEGVRSRSQNLESSFASPGMIRARSVIGNMKTIPESLPPQPSFQAPSSLNASTLASSSRGAPIPTIHPSPQNYEMNPYAADYPTPTYSQPQPQIQLQQQVPQQVQQQERVYSPHLLHSQLSTSSSIHPSMPQPQQQQLQIPQHQQQLQSQLQEYPRPRSSNESASHQHLLQQSLIQQPLHQSQQQQQHSLQQSQQQQSRGQEDYRLQQQQQLHLQAQRDPNLNQFTTLQSPSHLHQNVHQLLSPDQQQQLLLQSQLQQSHHQQQQRDQYQHQQHQQYQMQLQQQQQQQQQQVLRQQQHLSQQPPQQQQEHLSLDQQFLDQAFSSYPNFSNLEESLLLQSQQPHHHPQHQQQQQQQQDQQLDYLQQQLVGTSNDPFDPLNLQQHSGLDLGLSLSNLGMLPNTNSSSSSNIGGGGGGGGGSGRHSKSPIGGLMTGVGMDYEDEAEKRRSEERRRYEGLVYGTGE